MGVHWQVQIDKNGLVLLILCFSSLSVDEQTQENVILANPSAKGFSCSVFHPCLTQGLLGFGFVCFRMRAVNHQLAACCFYFFLLTLQIPFTNRRRTFSALLKRHDRRTRVLLVDSPCNVIPRWFAFIWKQAHLLGPGFGFPLQGAFQQWGSGA